MVTRVTLRGREAGADGAGPLPPQGCPLTSGAGVCDLPLRVAGWAPRASQRRRDVVARGGLVEKPAVSGRVAFCEYSRSLPASLLAAKQLCRGQCRQTSLDARCVVLRLTADHSSKRERRLPCGANVGRGAGEGQWATGEHAARDLVEVRLPCAPGEPRLLFDPTRVQGLAQLFAGHVVAQPDRNTRRGGVPEPLAYF